MVKKSIVQETAKAVEIAHTILKNARRDKAMKQTILHNAEDKLTSAESLFVKANEEHTRALRELK